MQGSVFFIESRVDRLLISFGLALGILSSSLLFFSSSDSGLLEGLEPIGTLKTVKGVQRRHSRALSWSKISKSGKLYPKDMVYTPPQSSAEVLLNTSQKLILEPESMVEFDTVASGTFKVVLVQGVAKIESEKGEATKVLQKEDDSLSVTPVLKRPSLPFFLVDIPAWGKKQGEIFQALGEVGSASKLIPEQKVLLGSLELKSLEDFSIQLGPVATQTGENQSDWQVLRWSNIPLPGILYEVEISRDRDFKRAIRQGFIKNRSLEVQLLDSGNYFWRVKAKGLGAQIQSEVGMLQVDKKR